MVLSTLLSKRLILLSGKGGVGKTTVAVALGLLASRLKKKTLLVEMNSTERVAPFFGLKEVGSEEIPLSPYLTGINISPQACFEEYVLKQIHFKKIFDAFINNRFVTYFLNAVPGLNELLMIGKIADLELQMKSKPKHESLFDLIIVDGPATGHGVSAFEVPNIVAKAVKIGPIKNQASKVIKLLADSSKTVFSVVTLSEEMPVVEAGELIQMVREKLKISLGPIFLNNFYDSHFTPGEIAKIEKKIPESKNLYPYFAYSHLASERSQLNEHYFQVLKKNNAGMEIIKIPHLDRGVATVADLKVVVDDWVKEM